MLQKLECKQIKNIAVVTHTKANMTLTICKRIRNVKELKLRQLSVKYAHTHT